MSALMQISAVAVRAGDLIQANAGFFPITKTEPDAEGVRLYVLNTRSNSEHSYAFPVEARVAIQVRGR